MAMRTADTTLRTGFDEQLAFIEGQLVSADKVLQVHRPSGVVCSCGRRQPCVHGESVAARRRDFERERAALLGPTILVAQLPGPTVASSSQAAGQETARRRWWWRRR